MVYIENKYSSGGPGAEFAASIMSSDSVSVLFRDINHGAPMRHFDAAKLAEALNGIVPGFTASYEKPVVVPQGVGSVVESEHGARYARLRGASNTPWTFEHGSNYYTDKHIERILRDGGKVIVDTTPKSD